MDHVVLSCGGTRLRSFEFPNGSMDVGSGRFCDIVVHDPEVPARACVLRKGDGTVWIEQLWPTRQRATRFGIGAELSVGSLHRLVREWVPGSLPRSPDPLATQPSIRLPDWQSDLCIRAGRQRVRLGSAAVTIGLSLQNDIVVHDELVSRQHCRIEPLREGPLLCDLGSTNGTWVDGVRVQRAFLRPGVRIRVGRSELVVLNAGSTDQAGDWVAASTAMRELQAEVARISSLSWPALVLGESGAGKEWVAKALHERGPRRDGPFVAINAGALPAQLVESELFGHEQGAFTGAHASHRGVFEQAHGGTLFLDEIGELSPDLQARLLRVLETGRIRRVGAEQTIEVDTRLVCATHRDLREMIERKQFRSDLFYRIARLVVHVPALRERPEDIEPLALRVLQQIASDIGSRILSDEALAQLLAYRWPGNVRELRNLISSAAVATSGEVIEGSDMRKAMDRLAAPAAQTDPVNLPTLRSRFGSVAAAARALGIPRTTFRDRLNASEES